MVYHGDAVVQLVNLWSIFTLPTKPGYASLIGVYGVYLVS